MRISTKQYYETSSRAMSEQQSNLYKVQQQMSSGKKLLTPSDDPVGADQALRLQQSIDLTDLYKNNLSAAQSQLSQSESVLGSMTDAMSDIRGLLVQAGNSTYGNSERNLISQELQQKLGNLMGLANSRDGAGFYLFGGNADNTAPFTQTVSGVAYNGDQGSRSVQISGNRNMQLNENGADLFMRTKTGNGVFDIQPATTNTGSAVALVGRVANASLLTGNNYQVQFTSANSYQIVNTTTSATVSSGTYTSGSVLSVDGMEMTITGNPASGDVFDVKPAANKDIFTGLTELTNLLSQPVSTDADKAKLKTMLNNMINLSDQTSDSVSAARTRIGARSKEVDSLTALQTDAGYNYSARLSAITDVDYAAASVDLTKQTVALQAAQKSYSMLSQLSLFSYIGG